MRKIHVRLTAELQADETRPHEVYVEQLTPPEAWAKDARDAHARLLTLLVTERYFELERLEGWCRSGRRR